jgi:RimJ/RimL family protein N-acetyltransferase
MIASDTRKKVDAFWADYFGASPADLNGKKTLVFPHKALESYDGVLVFRHADACLVSVPENTPDIERERLRKATPDQAFEPDFLARNFVVWKDRVSPPAWVGVCDPADFKDAPSAARLLAKSDEDAVGRLAEGCGETAWTQSKLALEREHNFGLFEGRDLVAASGYLVMGNALAYVGVITHPQHRGKGHARKVAAASIRNAFERGLVPMWRTPHANEAAIALAKSLGFSHYASTRDVRLVEVEF